MTNVLKKLAFPAVVCGALWLGSSAQAQVGAGDIMSISTTPGMEGTTAYASGTKIEIKIGMLGNCGMTNANVGPYTLPQLRMVVNGSANAFAQMEAFAPSYYPALSRTYYTFYYTVQPGDMAAPLKIYGLPGAGTTGDKYDVVNNGYVFYNKTTSSDLVWRFNTTFGFSTFDVYDLDFAQVAKRTIQTLSFTDSSATTVPATESTTWHVTSQNPINTGNTVSFYVWAANTNLVQVGSVAGQKALLVNMASGTTTVDFPITGLATGSTYIALQPVADYNNNATVVTNIVTRPITITTPPEPTVKVMIGGADSTILNESSALNNYSLTIDLSQSFAQDVWVRLDTTPAGQNNLTLVPSPYYVKVPAGSLTSSSVPFSLPDGTVTSLLTGVVISPTVTNAAAASVFTRMKSGTVYVRNVKPQILQPLATDTPTATRGEPFTFDWSVTDVPADMASGMTLTWNFGDGTANVVTSNATGSVSHIFTTPATGTGTKTVKVTAKDKDGTVSDEVQVTVTVVQPVPKPSLRVVPSAYEYSETSTNSTGVLNLYLSESFTEDVWVSLATTPAGQSNIVLSTTNAIRIPSGNTNTTVGIKFSIPDGTQLSEVAGIDIIPTVTNLSAKAYYTDLQMATVFVMNVAPKITKPVAGDLTAAAVAPYNKIPMGSPYPFTWTVADVPADGPTMAVTWDFGDGTTKTVTNLTGTVYHTYTVVGDYIVSVKAVDKDNGESAEIQFKATVVTPPPLPTVSIIPPAGPLDETSNPSTGSFTVHLSETFTNTVTVQLNVTPANSALNGSITLSTNRVYIAKGQTDVTVKFSAKDGTVLSRDTGFTVTPVVLATPEAVATFTEIVPGLIEILNVKPKINTPVASSTTGTDVAYTVPQGTPWPFYWDIYDVTPDLPTMSVTWYFGDGTTQTLIGGAGNVTHTYTAIGDMVVRVVAIDKDGERDEVQFKIRIAPSKAVNVTPIGPNMEANYWGAAGIGNGMVASPEARSSADLNNVYFFKYDPGVTSATLMAIPYKAGSSGYYVTNFNSSGVAIPGTTRIPYDSFFYVWVGTDQGLAEHNLIPAQAGSTVIVTLPSAATTGTTTTSVDTRDIQAIFSREYLASDNCGDINLDGIPDKIATLYNLPSIASGTTTSSGSGTSSGTPVELTAVGNYNGDADFLPGAASGGSAIIGGVSNVFATVGDPFTAFLEIRGFHPGLNSELYNSDPDFGPGETDRSCERPTNPTLLDTDGDNFPDGWEYYFWYNAKVKGMTGTAYNPLDVANGTLIDSKKIFLAFDPLVPATDEETGAAINRDLDNDGLSDIEELSIGTNPVNWDTDGDGMCDGWEVLRGLNPNDSRDGLNASLNNPDGDYMAYATANRQFVTVVNGATTKTYLAKDAVIGESTGTFTTWYRYGDTNAPIAVGRPVTLAAGDVVSAIDNVAAVLLHYQVYKEFGFDPRTAWTKDMPNSKPFTSVDEYLLLKFMAEVQRGGAATPSTTGAWDANSTHPLTPDTDATASGNDGMPDGWELYVACGPTGTTMAINPWNAGDDVNTDGAADGLTNSREFSGTKSSAAYANAAFYGAGYATVTITRPTGDVYWINKFWPTDPWNSDTDGDGLLDGREDTATVKLVGGVTARATTWQYGNPTDNNKACIRGGGLNPCSMDTDGDGLTDTWEYDFSGTNAVSAATGVAYIDGGMDGTHGPANQLVAMGLGDAFTGPDPYVTGHSLTNRNMDFDFDGLENYQEYWVQAVRSFRYDYTADQVPMDMTSDPTAFFTQITNAWDIARTPYMGWNTTEWVLLPMGFGMYATTDPRWADSDYDGMDDYYEMFHGLNPILGDTAAGGDLIANAYAGFITCYYNGWNPAPADPLATPDPLTMDFVQYPWLAGLDDADVDADGLRNLEEQLQPDTAAPSCSNTDPTPLWLTDVSNTNSVTARFYGPGPDPLTAMFFWGYATDGYKMYSFEMNEGYDTDNDGVSDKAELLKTATTQSDPQDHDDPRRRQALWFSGSQSAAQTLTAYSFGVWAFRSFTVELWARPEVINREQVLIERPVVYGASDLSNTGVVIRANFRVGIAADGRIYAMFQNAGLHDSHTGEVMAYGRVLSTNEWVHVTARMDGSAGAFELLLNGRVETTVPTALIPANGVNNLLSDADLYQYPEPYSVTVTPGVILLGATHQNALALLGEETPSWADYARFYQGYMDEVRVWDGARSNDEVLSDYTKRFSRTELLANRRAVRESEAVGGSRVSGVTPQLPPELLYHYTFDNLFSADRTASVAQAPRGFNDQQVTINRPADAKATWWDTLATKSTVYLDTGYVPWIENGVEHLPIFGSVVVSGGSIIKTYDSSTVKDSVFWSHYMAGELRTAASEHGLEKYNFPNSNNPYGYCYMTTMSGGGISVAGDLLPLGGAWAKQAADLWDNGGASGVWAETGNDTDSDGLPDWWEAYAAAIGLGTDLNWYSLLADGSGMTAGERYMRDLANGYTESNNPNSPTYNPSTLVKQTSDLDGDGLPDWWENLYNLVTTDATGDNGASGDPDNDGLSNYAEYLISERYGFRLSRPNKFKTSATQTESDYFQKQGALYMGEMFSDHDFIEDAWEDQYALSYASRFVFDAQTDADEDGWSNWAEARYSSARRAVRPDLAMKTEIGDIMSYEFPVPIVETTLRYNGLQSGGSIVLQAYSSADMNGSPDATYTISTDSSTATTKSEPIGYFVDKTVNGTLSPGSVQPGSLSLRFTDMWTQDARTTAFDVDGVLYSSMWSGNWIPIGTVDYATGAFTLNLGHYAGSVITDNPGSTNRTDYVVCDISYVEILYSVRPVDGWPKKLYLGRADTGHIREGANYFFAFLDTDADGAWSAGEPCGVSEGFGVDVGWDRNQMNIEMTDITPSFLRMTLSPAQRSEDVYYGTGTQAGGGGGSTAGLSGLENRVRVRRKSVDGISTYQRVVLDKSLKSARASLHEGDVFAQNEFGLDWGFAGVPTTLSRATNVYEVFLGNDVVLTNAVLTFTNIFDTVRAKAVTTSPINGTYVYSARPTFKWTMPQGYTAFTLEIRKGSSGGTVVYSSGTVLAPVRDGDGNCVWTAPIYAGDRVPSTSQIFSSNTAYAWRIIAMNSKFSETTLGAVWSDWKMFRLDVNQPLDSSGYGAIQTRVKYYGPATNLLSNRVKVQVYRNSAFAGVPESQYTLGSSDLTSLTMPGTTNVNAVLRGLVPSSTAGNYYVRAFIDHNQNGVKDAWESWGYANYYGITSTPFDAYPISVAYAPQVQVYDIRIEDADTDQDWYPDAWEYEINPTGDFLNLTGPSPATNPDTEVNPYLSVTTNLGRTGLALLTSGMALTTSDADRDGLSDIVELLLGSNATASSTAGDGFADGAKVSLGLSPSDTLTFNVTGLSLSDAAATLQWNLNVQKATELSRTLLSTTATTSARYEIQYKASLGDPAWTTLVSGTVTLDGAQPEKISQIGLNQINMTRGFFRVQLNNP